MKDLSVRQERMRLLALASAERLETGLACVIPPTYDWYAGRKPAL